MVPPPPPVCDRALRPVPHSRRRWETCRADAPPPRAVVAARFPLPGLLSLPGGEERSRGLRGCFTVRSLFGDPCCNASVSQWADLPRCTPAGGGGSGDADTCTDSSFLRGMLEGVHGFVGGYEYPLAQRGLIGSECGSVPSLLNEVHRTPSSLGSVDSHPSYVVAASSSGRVAPCRACILERASGRPCGRREMMDAR